VANPVAIVPLGMPARCRSSPVRPIPGKPPCAQGWSGLARAVEVTVDDSGAVEPGLLLFAAFVVRGLAEGGAPPEQAHPPPQRAADELKLIAGRAPFVAVVGADRAVPDPAHPPRAARALGLGGWLGQRECFGVITLSGSTASAPSVPWATSSATSANSRPRALA